MRIEDGYLITETPEEAKRIFIERTNDNKDEYRHASNSSTWFKLNGSSRYDPLDGVEIRRRLDRCSPDVLARAKIYQQTEFTPFL